MKRLVLGFLAALISTSAFAQTKLINTGYEADRLYKNSVTATFTTPDHPIILTGYQFKAAMIPSDAPLISSNVSAQVLWYIYTGMPGDGWGKVTFKDTTGNKQNLHGGADLASGILVVDIMKASPWTNAVNDPLIMTGWKVKLQPNSQIVLFAAHAGQGPIDFELQGGFSYEDASE